MITTLTTLTTYQFIERFFKKPHKRRQLRKYNPDGLTVKVTKRFVTRLLSRLPKSLPLLQKQDSPARDFNHINNKNEVRIKRERGDAAAAPPRKNDTGSWTGPDFLICLLLISYIMLLS